tara:strand:+ start:570 stop:791 length:222 start_codon:yes stop_codon:yes gene_type:complete
MHGAKFIKWKEKGMTESQLNKKERLVKLIADHWRNNTTQNFGKSWTDNTEYFYQCRTIEELTKLCKDKGIEVK